MQYINTYDINIWKAIQDAIDTALPRDSFHQPRKKPADSLEYTSSFFNLIHGNTIVECGTGLQSEMSGNSMLYWFNKTNASQIHCIDLDIKWINSIKNKFGSNNERIIYHHADCFDITPKIKDIDLIYMDFWTGDSNARALAYLELYKISNHPKMILIDDSDHTSPYKHTLIVPHAVNDGYKIIYTGRQTLLLRRDVSITYAKDLEHLGYNLKNKSK